MHGRRVRRGVADVTYSEGDGAPVRATARLIRNDVWVNCTRHRGTIDLRVEVEFEEFGVDVDVEPPPARRVVEASKLPG